MYKVLWEKTNLLNPPSEIHGWGFLGTLETWHNCVGCNTFCKLANFNPPKNPQKAIFLISAGSVQRLFSLISLQQIISGSVLWSGIIPPGGVTQLLAG